MIFGKPKRSNNILLIRVNSYNILDDGEYNATPALDALRIY